MSSLKKKIRSIIGDKNYAKLASFYRRSKPKIKSEKPIAFLFGFSKWKRAHTEAYLSEYRVMFMEDNLSENKILSIVERYQKKVFMTWGYNEKKELFDYAKKYNIPFYRMEDGFIRSIQLGAEHSVPLSMCIDSRGIYYDSTQPSDLENILNNYDFSSDTQLISRAKDNMQALNELKISKYNNVNKKDVNKIYGEKTKKRILVVGQVEDDQSIQKGCSVKITNNELVWIAKTENIDAQIIYKPHPDVLFGKRKMQSDPKDVSHIAEVITEPLSLTDALETIDHVYTITSLAGFEALIRGIKVTTIGAPFYSGWGLTDDRQPVERRKRTLTIEEVFAATYILYPRYLNPFTKRIINIEEAIQTLKLMRDISFSDKEPSNASTKLFLGFPEQYKKISDVFFNNHQIIHMSGDASLRDYKAKLRRYPDLTVYVWDNEYDNIKKIILDYTMEQKTEKISVGLGLLRSENNSELRKTPLLSVAFDTKALPNKSNDSSDLVDILNSYDFNNDTELLKRAISLISNINLNLENIAQNESELSNQEQEKEEKKRILVLGHNEQYASLSNLDLVWFAKTENPEDEIIFKPDVEGHASKQSLEEIQEITDVLLEHNALTNILENVHNVYTYNNVTGLEWLVRGVEVTTLGKPFYAGWGLTNDKSKINQRSRRLTLEELVAGAYILYPKYMNPFTNEIITAEKAMKLKYSIDKVNKKRINKLSSYDKAKNEKLAILSDDIQKNVADVIDEKNNFGFEIEGELGSNIGVLSKGIQVIPNLESFFKGNVIFNPKENIESLDFVAGWGLKPSATKAIQFAKENALHYLRLEDGFLRSVGLGVDGSPPLSICVDDIGIYYDATKPSRLENILNSDEWITDELLEKARKAMTLIKENYLSKYNHAPHINRYTISTNTDDNRLNVLIVDQTYGDMSISLGLANKEQFEIMYETAKVENPNANLYIKTHPDVISGKKQGNITDLELSDNTLLISEDCNPLSLIEKVDKVYVVTSQFGFEALMLGKEVHCFGMPFYAGWGITNDRLEIDRRIKRRTVEEVFAAAYMLYPRYINPITGNPGTIFDVIEYLSTSKLSQV